MEPISTAIAAFGAIKAGIEAGREISSLAAPLAKMWDACDEVRANHSKKRNRQFLSVNEEALSTFLDKQQAKDLEEQLRTIVVNTRGLSAWNELLQLRVDIKRQRKEAEQAEKRRRDEMREGIMIVGATVVGVATLTVIIVAIVVKIW